MLVHSLRKAMGRLTKVSGLTSELKLKNNTTLCHSWQNFFRSSEDCTCLGENHPPGCSYKGLLHSLFELPTKLSAPVSNPGQLNSPYLASSSLFSIRFHSADFMFSLLHPLVQSWIRTLRRTNHSDQSGFRIRLYDTLYGVTAILQPATLYCNA